MATEVEDGDANSLQRLRRLKDHSGKVQQLGRVERKLEELWKGLQRSKALTKDCEKEVAELRDEKESCLQRLSTIEQDIEMLELAHGELLEESEVYEGQLESLKRLQYAPLLAEVNKHQCDFGLPEVEEAVYLKGLPKTGKVEEKPKAPRVSRKTAAKNNDCFSLTGGGGCDREASGGRRRHQGPAASHRKLRAVHHRLHHSEKAGPSHKTCVHCSGSVARNAVMCKWCFEPVSRSNSKCS